LPYYFYSSYYFTPSILIIVPGIVLLVLAQWRVRSAYGRYSQIVAQNGQTAAQIAHRMLHSANLDDVNVEFIHGSLTDHYDPSSHVLSLSVDGSPQSIAAICVAAHEVGHAIQQAEGYFPLRVRSAIFPIVNVSSMVAIPLLILGFFLEINGLVIAALVLYASILFFQLVTLPLEYNASARAKALLADGILTTEEMAGANSVLNAAAMTYLAATLLTFLNFLRFVAMFRRR
jgi:uncharacterized protein